MNKMRPKTLTKIVIKEKSSKKSYRGAFANKEE